MTWHVPESTMRAYVGDTIADTDAWSIEAHLTECERCRHQVAVTAVGTPTAELVERSWSAVATAPPGQGRVRCGGRWRAFVSLAASGAAARGAWLLAMVVILLASMVLDLTGARVGAAGTGGGGLPWLTLLAPLIPVIGVAATYDAGLDDAGEIVASTPSGGLRLLLVRTLAVLVVVVPAAFVVGLVSSRSEPAGWLLPSLALTASTLAIGSAVGVATGAVAVMVAWFGVVGGRAFTARTEPAYLPADTPLLWLSLAALAVAVVALRAGAFSRLPLQVSVFRRREAER
ncbi:putative zinc finger protein [Haloactinopolyspora alba]|uniref:Putative zinc finger protein n=1 Tax=Haloactinopolyspora alba TaxID=648780 RepID=A0A2P8D6Z2_9ACTN|nr:zf-HC2 domain-containing protein [Haloactinopolyspora alba]PSK92996.1 putative zinc finger protein [Haloactinopolyspora alba]